MRILKEVLVLAVIVLVFAYAARRLEGVDAGEISAGVPPLMQSFRRMLGWDDGRPEEMLKDAAPVESTELFKRAEPSD
ncbi:hypothetical protein [Methyloceanibacter caenitepidi]|uniref:Uncharacterized protein n=1 Tax=Methyloceanibacter caenitepidi TaxID=1384459 RepID=A0A0A8K709_9HYPH|nr:hypothetical protein [Methyloceanibacter caenitepidi]BAQ17774.1 hypothetical protein GL4_2337 [Methyloceanibacter caenitepidi]